MARHNYSPDQIDRAHLLFKTSVRLGGLAINAPCEVRTLSRVGEVIDFGFVTRYWLDGSGEAHISMLSSVTDVEVYYRASQVTVLPGMK